MPDNKAIVHIAGAYDGVQQHCINCKCLLHDRSWDGNPWQTYAVIINHGHGGWSRLDNGIVDRTKFRPCGRAPHA